ncbi:MAG: cation:dicarboxylase symporter family transporter [Gemmatimonadota bacterium]
MVYYLSTTSIAVTIGIVLSNVVQPGGRIDPSTRDTLSAAFAEEAGQRVALAAERPSVVETLLNMIPRNPIQAAAEMDLLPLIIFTILFGAALTLVQPEKKNAVLMFAEGVNDAVMVLIDWIMKLAPYAVFALIAAVVARFGLDLLRSLLIYTLTPPKRTWASRTRWLRSSCPWAPPSTWTGRRSTRPWPPCSSPRSTAWVSAWASS